MGDFICSHESCENTEHAAKGYCNRHYQQFRTYGKTFKNTSADFNEIVDKGNYYELILTNKKGEEVGRTKIDKEDLEKVKAIGRWCLELEGYVANGKSGSIKMHRLIMDAKEDEEIDHKKTGFKNKADNRKKNLRICSHQQNMYNKNKQQNSTSPYKGVCYMKSSNKWIARIKVKGIRKYLGLFDTAEEAFKVYQKAARELHKEFFNK